MKKRVLSVALIGCMAAALLSGCGSSSSKETKAETKTETTAETTGETTAAATTAGGVQKIVDAGKLKVGCKVDVPSFGYQNTSTGEYEGLEIDLSYAIAGEIFGVTAEEAKEQGLVEFQGVTAKTRGPLLDNGEVDMVAATYTITDERKESWNFSTPYFQDALGLMCLTATGYTSMEDIDGAIIGVAQGSTTKDAIQAYIDENNLGITVEFQEFDGYPALSAALSAGNIDIFSVDRAILAGYNDDTTMILPERFGTQDYGVATALSNTELAEVVDKVVTDMKADGSMDELIKKWGIE
ncbi:MAG: transporter substrate-binding domain-containing protein [Clostridia bacterium]|nr:transporter substrate-binding domain-containing protein [Lachnospiraceae bacterium]NCC01362.1 transporter substrate-binding domain-containing protein [Clostridia bacterium]NCD02392.1 transporter substrate-binding domain-containing protein [Clostridia bacterium]